MYKKVVYLPVEFSQREFSEKLFLASKLLNSGYKIIIGEMNSYIFRNAKKSIILLKDNSKWSRKNILNLKKRGMYVCSLDEEALIIGDEQHYLSTICPDTLNRLDKLFLWGNKHKEVLNKLKLEKKNQVITGSLKFDLCRQVRKKAKNLSFKKILFNTRFSFTNSIRGSFNEELEAMWKLGFVNNQDDEDYIRNIHNSDILIFEEHINLMLALAKKGVKVTIRAHPHEDENTYINYFQNIKNITIDRTTDLRQQILEHDAIVHDGCTTALEALCIGVPVFSLRPSLNSIAYDDFSNQYSMHFNSHKNLLDFILKNKTSDFKFNFGNINSYIKNWSNEDTLCADEICLELNKLKFSQKKLYFNYFCFFDYLKYIFYNIIIYINKYISISTLNEFEKSYSITTKKFCTSTSMVYDNIKKYTYNRIDVNKVSLNVYCLKAFCENK
jgi:surface carbohydrate biosynthesis protein